MSNEYVSIFVSAARVVYLPSVSSCCFTSLQIKLELSCRNSSLIRNSLKEVAQWSFGQWLEHGIEIAKLSYRHCTQD